MQVNLSIICILFLGIPHGAIDHILYEKQEKRFSTLRFNTIYLGLMAVYLVFWILFPTPSLIAFLILSSYHFGQSQFSDLPNSTDASHNFLALSWGMVLLSGLVLFNLSEVVQLFEESETLASSSFIFQHDVFLLIFVLSLSLTVLLLLFHLKKKRIGVKRLFTEVFILSLLLAIFYFLPLLIAFTIYFTIWHSCRVLYEEYEFLAQKIADFSFQKFIKLLFPYSAISICFSIVGIMVLRSDVIGISNILLILIFLSILTLPHTFVIYLFYKSFYKKEELT